MEWCGSQTELVYHHGPSECLCFAIISPIPCILVTFYLISRHFFCKSNNQELYDSRKSTYIFSGILCCCFLHAVIFGAISLLENITPAKIFAVVVQLLGWLACGLSIYHDYADSKEWPCLAINVFILAEMMVSAIVAATVFGDDHLPVSFILGIVLFLVALAIGILSHFKDSLDPSIYDDENNSCHSQERSSLLGSMGLIFFGVSGSSSNKKNDDNDGLNPLLSNRALSTGSDGDQFSAAYGFDERESFGSSGGIGHPSTSRWSVASEEVSLVKSAMEVRFSDVEKGARATSAVGYYSATSPKKAIGAGAGNEMRTGIVSSRALARVLEQPQSSRTAHALSSTSSGLTGTLAPGGALGATRRPTRRSGGAGGGEFSAATRRDRSTGRESQSGTTSRISSGMNPLDSLHLLVEKWGLRRPGYGHEETPLRVHSGAESWQLHLLGHAREEPDDDNSSTPHHHPRRLESFARLEPTAQRQRDLFLSKMSSDENMLAHVSEDCEMREGNKVGEGVGILPSAEEPIADSVGPERNSVGELDECNGVKSSMTLTASSSSSALSSIVSGAADLSSRISLLSPSSSSASSGQLMELEFELSLSLLDDNDDDIFSTHSAGNGWGGRAAKKVEAGEADGMGSREGQWSVWRTGKELLSLHAVLVGLFGDLAPRRPKLRTCGFDATARSQLTGVTSASLMHHTPPEKRDKTSVSREAILSDMRLIAGYLRALISQPIFHCPAFHTFLDIPQHVKLAASHEESIVPASLTRDFSSSSTHFDTSISSRRGAGETGDPMSALLAASAGGAPIEGSGSSAEVGGVSSAPMGSNRGAMDAAAEDNSADQKDRWRKVFLNLRKNLKPRVLAVRCRVFEGVITGEDISRWLVTSVYEYAHDSSEASLIAQGLLSVGRLCPMLVGYSDRFDEVPTKEQMYTFSPSRGYVYRYPGRYSTFSLFGAGVTVSIPQWVQVDADGNVSTGKEKDSETGGAGFIQYVVSVKLVDDMWTVTRRYNEFSALHKMLQKEKIRPLVAFPSTSFGQLMLGQVSAVVLDEGGKREQRRADLENYLKSAVEAVLLAAMEICDDPSDVDRMLTRRQRLLSTLAEFLDNDHRRLLVVPVDAVAAAPQPPPTEEEDISSHNLQNISNALGL